MVSTLLSLAACDADPDSQADVINTQFDGALSGGAPPSYPEPIPITSGDYLPEDFPFEEVLQESINNPPSTRAPFHGRIGEFEVVPVQTYFEGAIDLPKRCEVSEFRLRVRMTFAYLPGGSFARSPQYEALCADGSVTFVSQEFLTKHGRFTVTFRTGDRVVAVDAPDPREVSLGGKSVLVADPLISEGLGPSSFAFATDNGFVLLESVNLPSSESMKIIAGLKCEDC
jgi:hypothetical protein